MRRPAPWASRVAARGRSISPKAPAPARSRRGLQQRLVGARERDAVDRHQAQRGTGHVDALPEAHGGEEARGLVGGELLEQASLGQVALREDRDVESELEGRGGLVEHAEAREQGERAAPGRLDQVAELVGERLDVRRGAAGRGGGAAQ